VQPVEHGAVLARNRVDVLSDRFIHPPIVAGRGANAPCAAAYADIDSGVAVAVMRNRFTAGDFSTVTLIDQIVADTLS